MIRKMRRLKQQLTEAECIEILDRGTAGVLSVYGDDGYPYSVPLSYVYSDGKLFFHCARTGHKIDGIKKNDKVSFCVIGQDHIVPKEFTTYYKSVIAFGRAHILNDDREKRKAIKKLAEKYNPGDEAGQEQEIDKEFPLLCMIELAIEHMTGKEAIELVKMKGRKPE